ncbi:MAG: hypothetical protein HY268_21675 [Deltaproteobacteria bacterium]|nr:hypothetical protein [Deltaproteobacteria bacterium]
MNVINRRQLLKGAVLGSAGVLSVTAIAPLGLEQPTGSQLQALNTAGERNPNFAMGLVQTIDGGTIVSFNEDSLVQRIEILSETRVWKGQDTTLDAVLPGDFFYARGEPTADGRFLVETMWVNIVNLHLQINDIDATGKRFLFSDSDMQFMGHIRPYTIILRDIDQPASRDFSGLQISQHVQIIGCWHPGTHEFDISRIYT